MITLGTKSNPRAVRAGTLALVAALVLAAGLFAPRPAVALCGDVTGDGYVAATDALAALHLAVERGYDRAADLGRGAEADDRVTATDSLGILIAAVSGSIPPCRAATATRAAVATASFLFDAAGLALIDFETHTPTFRGGVFAPDSVLRAPMGRLFGVNRLNGNSLQEIDPSAPELPTVKECSVSDGFNSNPHDVALLPSGKGYVTVYEGNELLVLDTTSLDPAEDPACSDLIAGYVDLRSVSDADEIPEMDQMVVVVDRLYVLLQSLVHAITPKGIFPPDGPARIAVVDTTTDTLLGAIPLTIENPFSETKGIVHHTKSGRLYVGGPGVIGADYEDGGLEAVDLAGQTSLGMLVSGADLGGDLFDFVIVGTERAYVSVVEADGASVLLEVDLATGSVTDELIRTASEQDIPIADIELTETGELWVAYREDTENASPGIRIFDIADNHEITTVPIWPGSPPFNIVFLD